MPVLWWGYLIRRMSGQRTGMAEPTTENYPIPPNTIHEEKITPKQIKSENRNIILFSLIYVLYGFGISIYGPLYPAQARQTGLNSPIYGSVIGTSHFISILFYPVSCLMVSKVSPKIILSASVFVIGACRVLFGTLNLISDELSFIAISYAVQSVEGIGLSILIVSTVVSACYLTTNQIANISYYLQASLCLGLILGPVTGAVVKEELGFDIVFYLTGCLTTLSFIFTAVLLKEPEQRIAYEDMPIISWINDRRMLICFFIIFSSFNYIGFLSVSLEHILKKFHLNYLYAALVFSISPFVYVLSAPGWTWLIKKGFNNVMMVFIGSVVVMGSLVLLGPMPYTSIKGSFSKVCWALGLEGLGIACKSSCVLDALQEDLSLQNKYTKIQQQFIFPIVFILGASLGYFCGSLTDGFASFYIGYRKATLPLFGLEIATAIVAVIFALNRNYHSKRRRDVEENRPILSS